MRQTAIIKSISDSNIALVEVTRKSACSSCKQNSENGCSTCNIFNMDNKIEAKATNELGAKVGDIVEIETPSKMILSYAVIVFILPLVSGLIFYLLGTLITKDTIIPYFLSLAGFILSFVFIYFVVNKKAQDNTNVKIVSIKENKGK